MNFTSLLFIMAYLKLITHYGYIHLLFIMAWQKLPQNYKRK